MRTIENETEILEALSSTQNHKGAFATCRVLPGKHEQENCQEWGEHCELHGAPATIFYLFDNSECEDEDASNYPWDAEHVSKIHVSEKECDGD